MTFPIIEGLDGVQKMSKSLGNHVALKDPPREMFGKMMSLPDALMERYYRYVSAMSSEEVQAVLEDLKSGSLHPREAKAQLAERMVSLFHSEAEAREARREFDQVFRDKGIPGEIETVRVSRKNFDIVELLKECGLVQSKGEARRLIEQGGVKMNQQKVEDAAMKVDLSGSVLLQCGKRKFVRVEYRDR
jgi:tyrosyl-tRNA synthetase